MQLLFLIIATGYSFLEASSGFIESPNYPNSYPNHQDKTYNIEIENGQKIEITFESFDLEFHSYCAWDWMKVVDIGQGKTLLEKSCGSNIPAKIISTSNKVDVIFHSDYSVTRKGFKLSWRALDMTLDGSYACLTPPHNPKSVRGAQKDGIDLWDGGVVPYEMTSSFQDSDKKTFLKAIQEIEEGTCLRFKPRTDESAYIKAARECDCTSGTCSGGAWVFGLGKQSPSRLYIGKTCLSPDKREAVALVIHEILHSLGVVHTQTRPDRNDYIVVNESNIQNTATARYQYEICQACLTYNTPYNCMSVMHYKDYFFNNGNGPTMVKKESNTAKCDLHTYPTKLENSDIELLNKMYKCKPDTSLFATCDNLMRIYFDGVLQFEDEGWPGTHTWAWTTTTELVIPSGTKVLGIECKNLGGPEGIIASTPDGLMTDGSWQCSHNENLVGWADPDFVDTAEDFNTAINVGGYTNDGEAWGIRPGIDTSSQWIWADQGHSWAACRKKIGPST